MRLRGISEDVKFDFYHTVKPLWRDAFSSAKKRHGVSFDTENDEDVHIREIRIGVDEPGHNYAKYVCELRKAGGDWEAPTIYFRCQIVDGYAEVDDELLSGYDGDLFCVIPGKDEGNKHLVCKKGKCGAPDGDIDGEDPSERACWAYLKKYLAKVTKAGHERMMDG